MTVDLGMGLTLHRSPEGERFKSLPESEQDRIIDGFATFMRRMLGDMTMEEFLTERRRETERENA